MIKKTVTETRYAFDELAPDAQEAAIQQERQKRYQCNEAGQDTFQEFRASLKAFCDLFCIDLEQFERDHYRAWPSPGLWGDESFGGAEVLAHAIAPSNDWNNVSEPENFKGIRLWKWLMRPWRGPFGTSAIALASVKHRTEGYSLTGTYSDHGLMEPLAAFLARPDSDLSLADLIERCIDGFNSDLRSALDYPFEDDTIREYLSECMGEEFTEDGEHSLID